MRVDEAFFRAWKQDHADSSEKSQNLVKPFRGKKKKKKKDVQTKPSINELFLIHLKQSADFHVLLGLAKLRAQQP